MDSNQHFKYTIYKTTNHMCVLTQKVRLKPMNGTMVILIVLWEWVENNLRPLLSGENTAMELNL